MAIKISGTTVIDDSRNLLNANSAVFTGNSHVQVPIGTDAQRTATPANGMFRYSTTSNSFEGYSNGQWGAIAGSGGTDPNPLLFTGT